MPFRESTPRTAQQISNLLGTTTDVREQVSVSGNRFALWFTHASRTTVVAPRPLLTAGEVMQLPQETALIMQAGHPPVFATKLRYYADARFTDRVLPPPALNVRDLPPRRPSPWLREDPKSLLPEVPV